MKETIKELNDVEVSLAQLVDHFPDTDTDNKGRLRESLSKLQGLIIDLENTQSEIEALHG
jgi:hypothetical protein